MRCFSGLGIDLRGDMTDLTHRRFRWDGGEFRFRIAAALESLFSDFSAINAMVSCNYADG